MLDKLKEMPEKLLEFWNKYTAKQKAIIISVIVTVLLAILILVFVLTRTKYTHLVTISDEASVTELQGLLDNDGIAYKTENTSTGYEITVDQSKTTEALLLMGDNEIVGSTSASDMDWEEALDNSIDTTEGEKSQKYTLAFQSEIRKYLKSINGVNDAFVSINSPEDDGTIFSENQESSVAVMLDLSDELEENALQGMANYLATAIGNKDTEMITIVDTNSNLLFDGSSEEGISGGASSTAQYQEKLRAVIENDLKQILLKADYNEVEIGASNIRFDMDQVSSLYTEYSTPEGREQGPYSSSYEYNSTGTSGSGGIPGTDPNADDTDYMLQNGGSSNSEVVLNKYEYDVNKKETTRVQAIGAMDAANSSVAIVLKQYVIYDEAKMEAAGELEGTTFEQFQSENSKPTQIAVSDDVIDLIEKATGISTTDISVIAYEQPIFTEAEAVPVATSSILMIVLAVLIVALLIFVVFKGTAPMDVTELEPELSVEQLLATTKENQSLEDIEFGQVSETRKMIEKFVDENPEAVAQLLRNWINEDWG